MKEIILPNEIPATQTVSNEELLKIVNAAINIRQTEVDKIVERTKEEMSN